MALHRDFRKLDPTTQAELRRVAVAMVEAGETRGEASAAVGVNRRFVGVWVEAARRFGDAALDGGRRGRRLGEQKPLSPRQEQRIRRLIADRCPDQLKLPFPLWTREAVGALIERETGDGYRHPPSGAPCGPGSSPRSARHDGPQSGASPRSGPGSSASTQRSPPGLRPRAPRSTGATRPDCRTRPITAGASPRGARPPSCRGRRHGSRSP